MYLFHMLNTKYTALTYNFCFSQAEKVKYCTEMDKVWGRGLKPEYCGKGRRRFKTVLLMRSQIDPGTAGLRELQRMSEFSRE